MERSVAIVSCEQTTMADLRRLVSYMGPEERLAGRLALQDADLTAVGILVDAIRGDSPELQEIQALRAIVRILGTLAGDATGDTVPDVSSSGSLLVQGIRSEVVTGAVVDLLQRRLRSFPPEEQPWLLLDGLRAMRLLLVLPESAKTAQLAGQRNKAAWWVEEDVGYTRHGEARRRLGEVLVQLLDLVKDSSKAEMKAAAFGALQNLVTGSSTAFRHVAQTNIAEKVVLLAQAQMKSLPHVAIADGCRLLTLLCAGPRSHLRKVTDANALALSLELLKRLEVHREIASAALVLLSVVAPQEDGIRPDTLELCAGVVKRFPQQVREELSWARTPVSGAILALLPKEV